MTSQTDTNQDHVEVTIFLDSPLRVGENVCDGCIFSHDDGCSCYVPDNIPSCGTGDKIWRIKHIL